MMASFSSAVHVSEKRDDQIVEKCKSHLLSVGMYTHLAYCSFSLKSLILL